jgi:hypothetical protein
MAANNPFLAASGAAANNPFAAFAAKKEAQVADDPFAPKKTGEKCGAATFIFQVNQKSCSLVGKGASGLAALFCVGMFLLTLTPDALSLRTLVYRVNQLQRGSRTRSWQAFHLRPQAVHLLTVRSEWHACPFTTISLCLSRSGLEPAPWHAVITLPHS